MESRFSAMRVLRIEAQVEPDADELEGLADRGVRLLLAACGRTSRRQWRRA